jgi:hypothetical protein
VQLRSKAVSRVFLAVVVVIIYWERSTHVGVGTTVIIITTTFTRGYRGTHTFNLTRVFLLDRSWWKVTRSFLLV